MQFKDVPCIPLFPLLSIETHERSAHRMSPSILKASHFRVSIDVLWLNFLSKKGYRKGKPVYHQFEILRAFLRTPSPPSGASRMKWGTRTKWVPHVSHTGATRGVRSSQHGWIDTSGTRVKTKTQRSKKRGVAERSEVGVNLSLSIPKSIKIWKDI